MDPDDLLAGPAVEAAVAALAERNRHHVEQMAPEEREDALVHWRELAITVLMAARSATGGEDAADPHGRATIVLEDSGGEEVTVHATFWPEMQDLGGGELAATPAQIAALELLEQLTGGEDDE
jgi:peptidoglycan/xylan/chitin deacetylase (PgdA/CDA1 family)